MTEKEWKVAKEILKRHNYDDAAIAEIKKAIKKNERKN